MNGEPLQFENLYSLLDDDENFTMICRDMALANGSSRVSSFEVRERFKWIIGAFHSVDYEKLSVRAVYYRVVSLYGQPKTEKFYGHIQTATSLMRDYGLLPFDKISDGSRSLYTSTVHDDKESFMSEMADTYKKNMWQDSEVRVVIVVEKMAMVDVLMPICSKYGIAILPSRGYNSKTAWYELTDRHVEGTILHLLLLTDYDTDGLEMGTGGLKAIMQHGYLGKMRLERIGLNPEQISEMNLPTRQDKKDPLMRACELDAMTPSQARDLVEKEVLRFVDLASFERLEMLEEEEKAGLRLLQW